MELTKGQSRNMIREIRALWREWDPIGVYSSPQSDCPPDEYDRYLGPCLRLLEQGTTTHELAQYLSHIVGEYMGLGEPGRMYSRPAEFARKLQAWYTTAWRGTHVQASSGVRQSGLAGAALRRDSIRGKGPMKVRRKIVIHSLRGLRPELAGMVEGWIRDGVQYVGVIGQEAARIEDAIDDLCVGVGIDPYFMLTVAHDPADTLEDAILFAEQVATISGSVEVVEL